jgi:H+-transporting ATPase
MDTFIVRTTSIGLNIGEDKARSTSLDQYRKMSTDRSRNNSVELGKNPIHLLSGKPAVAGTASPQAKDINAPEEGDHAGDDNFVFSHGITSQEAKRLLEVHGRNELPEKVIPKWYIFVSQLWQPMPIMIWIAAIVEAGIQNWLDMSILLAIQFTNASIGYYEITKAGDAVAALKKSLKPSATVKRDGKFEVIDAALLVPGDLVLLGSGSAVPADCRVNHGEIEVDEAALTGESLPVTKFQNSSCKMGSTVVRGEVEGTVEFTGANTFFGKTAALLGVSFPYCVRFILF